MRDPLTEQAVAVLHEGTRLLMMGNQPTSLRQLRRIVNEGPDGSLLCGCVDYIEREWPGETQAAGIMRDFHALPPAELAALRVKLHQICDAAKRPGGGELAEAG